MGSAASILIDNDNTWSVPKPHREHKLPASARGLETRAITESKIEAANIELRARGVEKHDTLVLRLVN